MPPQEPPQHSGKRKKKKVKNPLKTLQRYQRLLRQLVAENHYYRCKTQQGNEDEEDNELQQKVAHALINDLRAHELMTMLRGTEQDSPAELPYTQKRLHAAVTPQRISEVQAMSVDQVADKMRQLVQQIGLCLSHSEPGSSDLAPLSQAMDEFADLSLLLHIANDAACLKLCLLNLDTKLEQQAPDNWWREVAEQLALQPSQAQKLSAAYDVFCSKRMPLVQRLQEVAGLVLEQLQPLGACPASPDSDQQSLQRGDALHVQQLQQQLTHHRRSASVSSMTQQLSLLEVPDGSEHQLKQGISGLSIDSSSCHNSSGSTDSQLETAPVPVSRDGGLLDWATADLVHEQLQELMLLTRQLRELGRNVVFLFINTLDLPQLAVSVTASYPW
eukprot:gene2522-2824_t